MNDSASKRLRLRFFPEDERAVDEALSLTTHSSKSNVIRAALSFYDSVWASAREGFRVLYRREGADDQDVLAGDSSTKRTKGERARTETSIEIRITPADHERIEGLLAREAADTSSEVVRRAVRLYCAVAGRRREGWEVVAVSPSGDGLHVTVPGLGLGPSEKAVLVPVRPAQPAASRVGRSLAELLPRSLAAMVDQLAAKEGCPPEVLLIDLVRTEASARYHGLIREPVVVEPLDVIPAPEEPVVVEVVEAPVMDEPPVQASPQAAAAIEHDDKLITALSEALDAMERQIENVMQLLGESTRSEGQQELSDLLFSSDDGDTSADSEQPQAPLARLSSRARELNERLVSLGSLVALVPRKGKGRARKGDAALSSSDPDSSAIAAGN